MAEGSFSQPETDSAVPPAERRPILLRAYADVAVSDPDSAERRSEQKKQAGAPEPFTLIFDTETTADETQRMRFGTFQVCREGEDPFVGLFFEPDGVTRQELAVLRKQASVQGYQLMTRAEFVNKHLFAAILAGGTIVGLNLPFDLSRLAIAVSRAKQVSRWDKGRTRVIGVDRFMVGGFSFTLSLWKNLPHVRVKHLSRRAAFINVTHAGKTRSHERGFFLDVRTLAAALTSRAHSLKSLAKALEVKQKADFEDFDKPIDATFIEYALRDTEVTRLCSERIIAQYRQHGLAGTQAHRIFSEASLGKAYLREMNIRPWRKEQPDFDPELIGAIMSSYFGGRAEVHRRREILRTLYCDFASMYPTVCTLMGLWKFTIAKGVETQDVTSATQTLLDGMCLDDLRKTETWKDLAVLVRVLPKADIFPVRARYGEEPMATIGVNHLTAERPLWFTLADCIVSKLLTGRAPTVIEAITFNAAPTQDGLRSIRISGKEEYQVNPTEDDFYRRIIDLRRKIKAKCDKMERDGAPKGEVDKLFSEQLALKILANATSYGIFVELNVEDAADPQPVKLCASAGARTAVSRKLEKPGEYFHPLLGTLITGAARLMLAITERLLIVEGLDWIFCDTDSMAFANAKGMAEDEFVTAVSRVCGWFEVLNPYEEPGPILEFEEQNYRDPKKRDVLEPLFCAAISAKRYALFNLNPDGSPIIRKASAHGLGHYLPPYREENEDERGRQSGVQLWQEDLWKAIIRSLQSDNAMSLPLDWHPSLNNPAASQYTASNPERLDWFADWNEGKSFADQVKPFNFMIEFHGRKPEDVAQASPELFDDAFYSKPHPIAPYSRDPLKVLDQVWDQKTRRPVPCHWLHTYADALRNYHLHPETKALNGGALDSGPTRRRHVFVNGVEDIGKEANRWDDDEPVTIEDDYTVHYGKSADERARMIADVLSVKKTVLADAAGVSHRSVPSNTADAARLSDAALVKLFDEARRLKKLDAAAAAVDEQIRGWLAAEIKKDGLARFAERLEVDPSNLAKVISRKRRPTKVMRIGFARFHGLQNLQQ